MTDERNLTLMDEPVWTDDDVVQFLNEENARVEFHWIQPSKVREKSSQRDFQRGWVHRLASALGLL